MVCARRRRDARIDPSRLGAGPFNLNSALNLHSGALAFTIESPSHVPTAKRDGKTVVLTPDDLVTAQILFHQEAMKFLSRREAGTLALK